jgi:hypothetical protein
MPTPERCRERSAAYLSLARKGSDATRKAELLKRAQDWMEMAERVQRHKLSSSDNSGAARTSHPEPSGEARQDWENAKDSSSSDRD